MHYGEQESDHPLPDSNNTAGYLSARSPPCSGRKQSTAYTTGPLSRPKYANGFESNVLIRQLPSGDIRANRDLRGGAPRPCHLTPLCLWPLHADVTGVTPVHSDPVSVSRVHDYFMISDQPNHQRPAPVLSHIMSSVTLFYFTGFRQTTE